MRFGVPAHVCNFDTEIQMTLMQWRICALAALLPLSAALNAAQADPTDPSANVPPARYDSAFKSYIAAEDDSVSPDKGWRAANDAVADKPGQGHMTRMQMGGSMSMPMPGKAADRGRRNACAHRHRHWL